LQEEENDLSDEVRKIEFEGTAEPPSTYGHIVSEKVLLTDDLKKLFTDYSCFKYL
jgi:type I restriction enzyme R subunit